MFIKKLLGGLTNTIVVLSFFIMFATLLGLLIYGLVATSVPTEAEIKTYLTNHEQLINGLAIGFICVAAVCALFFVIKTVVFIVRSGKTILKSIIFIIIFGVLVVGALVIGIIIYTKVTGSIVDFTQFKDFFNFIDGKQLLGATSPATILLITGTAVSGLGLIAAIVSCFKGNNKQVEESPKAKKANKVQTKAA
ncbi:hypothetical protein [Williamsoniiplasma lucivorax]|uniref:Uncharacterized protein n=1 Tax=Williamsoniiplasma lucivorax TaxID=209274 RepID=A0A2S5RCR1_9MOLU|nr:hypothetical protein [Williamsoniiplasma lucivorax]PPE05116.1 hypothetical protein ELUCI_v1c06520 [Williamsoniiplasma lucivorax]